MKGDSGTVIDLGTGNSVSGFSTGKGNKLGPRMREAQAIKREILEATPSDNVLILLD